MDSSPYWARVKRKAATSAAAYVRSSGALRGGGRVGFRRVRGQSSADVQEPFADGSGRHGGEVHDLDAMLGRDAQSHAGAALGASAGRPCDDGVDRGVELRPEEDGGVATVRAPGEWAALMPGGVKTRREGDAGFHVGRLGYETVGS